jgi:hypothetical protein
MYGMTTLARCPRAPDVPKVNLNPTCILSWSKRAASGIVAIITGDLAVIERFGTSVVTRERIVEEREIICETEQQTKIICVRDHAKRKR